MKLILLLNLRQKGLENHTWALNSLTQAGREKVCRSRVPRRPARLGLGGDGRAGSGAGPGGSWSNPTSTGDCCVPAVSLPSLWEPPSAAPPGLPCPRAQLAPAIIMKYLQSGQSFCSQPAVGEEQSRRVRGGESSGDEPQEGWNVAGSEGSTG